MALTLSLTSPVFALRARSGGLEEKTTVTEQLETRLSETRLSETRSAVSAPAAGMGEWTQLKGRVRVRARRPSEQSIQEVLSGLKHPNKVVAMSAAMTARAWARRPEWLGMLAGHAAPLVQRLVEVFMQESHDPSWQSPGHSAYLTLEAFVEPSVIKAHPEFRQALEGSRHALKEWIRRAPKGSPMGPYVRAQQLLEQLDRSIKLSDPKKRWEVYIQDDLAFDRRSKIHRAALDALAKAGPEVVPLLIEALEPSKDDRSWRDEALHREGAAIGLGRMGPKAVGAVEPLIGALNDGDHRVRFAAMKALISIGDKRAIPVLIESLGDDRFSGVQEEVIAALGEFGPRAKRARARLEFIMDSSRSPRLLRAAHNALNKISSGLEEVSFTDLMDRLKELWGSAESRTAIVQLQFKGPVENLDVVRRILRESPQRFSLDPEGARRLEVLLETYSDAFQADVAVQALNDEFASQFNRQQLVAALRHFIETDQIQILQSAAQDKKHIFAILGLHIKPEDLDEFDVRLGEIVTLARAQGRPVVFLWEQAGIPLWAARQALAQGAHEPKLLTDDPLMFGMLIQDSIIQMLYEGMHQPTIEMYRSIFNDIPLGVRPARKIEPFEDRLFEILARHRVHVVEEETDKEIVRSGLLSQVRMAMANMFFRQGNWERYLEEHQEAVQLDAQRYVDRDETVVRQIHGIKRQFPGAYVVLFRGGMHIHLIRALQAAGYDFEETNVIAEVEDQLRPAPQVIMAKVRDLEAGRSVSFTEADNDLLLEDLVTGVFQGLTEKLYPRSIDFQRRARIISGFVSPGQVKTISHVLAEEGVDRFDAMNDRIIQWVLEENLLDDGNRKLVERALAQAGVEEGAVGSQNQLTEFFGELKKSARRELTPVVIGVGLEERYPQIKRLAAVPGSPIRLSSGDLRQDVVGLVSQDVRSVVFAGSEEQAADFRVLSGRAGISVRVITPRREAEFTAFILAVLAESSGLEQSVVAAQKGFGEMLDTVGSLAGQL